MATGGEFGYDDKGLDDKIDNDSMADDQDTVNRTQPFEPYAASTPYHRGEQHEMQTMQHEQSGLPSYDERTPLLPSDEELQRRFDALRKNPRTGIFDTTQIDTSINPLSEEDREKQIQMVKRLIKSQYPNVNFRGLVIQFSKIRPMDIVVLGPKGGETKVVLNDGSGLQKSFLNLTYVKKALGPPGREIITQVGVHLESRQKELEKEREDLLTQQQNLRKKDEEIQRLAQRIEKEEAIVGQLKENQGPEYEEEMKRKNQLLKNLKKDFETKEKERKDLEKKSKKSRKKTRGDRPTSIQHL